MRSEDEDDLPLGGGRSPTPPERSRTGARGHHDQHGSGRGRSDAGFGAAGAGQGGKGGRRARTTGRALPELHTIHRGTIASVQSYGAFVRLGDGSEFKDGLLHISKLSATGRVEKAEDVVSAGDEVWVKVVEVRAEESKYSLDMRFVGQRDGEDKDPNNVQVDAGGGRGRGAPEPIRIGAVQSTTCSRCGSHGHAARECWAPTGAQYSLVEEPPGRPPATEGREAGELGHDAKFMKEALQYYLKRKAKEAVSSSSSSSSDTKAKKRRKKEKKARKKEKKAKKKLKKAQKKAAKEAKAAKQPKVPKEAKKAARAAAAEEAPGPAEKAGEESGSSSSS